MSRKHDPNHHCHHISPRGQRCRMLRAPNHEALCAYHLQQTAAPPLDHEALAAELLASTGDLSSANEVNTLLGNLVRMLAHKRIDRKDAIAIAYMSQLLLNTLTPLERELQAEQKAAGERAFAQRLAEMNARLTKQAPAAAAPPPSQTAASRPAPASPVLPAAPPANVASPDPRPPKTYADVRT